MIAPNHISSSNPHGCGVIHVGRSWGEAGRFKFILALIGFLSLIAPAFAQAPAPVPALPDTERRTSYNITASQCNCAVNFALFGDSTDVGNWIEVFVNGALVPQSGNWAITSPSGPIANLARPITDAVLNFTVAQTGTVQIVGARRPRRISQFQENQGVPARDLNLALTDLVAQNRENWDKTNDVTGRALLARPGETLALLPALANRLNQGACFDGSGNLVPCISIPSSTFTAGTLVAFSGANPTTINVTPIGTAPIVIDPSTNSITCPTCQTTAANLTSVSTIASLKALSPPAVATSIFVMGYFSRSDGGEGWFNFDTTSSGVDDGGTIIIPNSAPTSGRWIRSGTGMQYNVRWFGAAPDNTTDSAPAIRAAYNAVPNGGAIYFPAGNVPYVVNSCTGNNAVIDSISTNANKSVSILGDGWNIKSVGSYGNPRGSIIRLGASIPGTCSFIRYAGTDIVTGITLKDFAVVASTGTYGTPVGLHGIFIDESIGASAFYLTQMNIDHVFIDNMSAGYSIKVAAVNSGVFSGGLAFSSIRNSQLMNINATFLGDGVSIDHNTFGQNATIHTRNVGLEFSQVSGATSTVITRNIFSNFDGMVIVHGAESPIIRDNELEMGNVSNAAGALIYLQGDTSTVDGAVISGNSVSQNSTVANYNAANTLIEGNTIRIPSTYDFVTITGAATSTRMNTNRCAANGTMDPACTVSSVGPNGSQLTPYCIKLSGSSNGLASLCTPSAAGTPSIALPTTSGTLLTNAGAVSATKTVRASGGASDCTLIFTSGVLTGGTC
jgi:hypothetical protein